MLLRIAKVHAAHTGVTYAQALDETLCYGWIDGVRRSRGVRRTAPPISEMEDSKSSIKETARQFFDARGSGKGWEVCKQYCHPEATFTAQADALSGVTTLEAYTNWAKGLLTPMPDARYEILHFAVDDELRSVAGYSVFRGTHTGEGGPVPPTGKKVEADYVYVMQFDGDRIRRMTKIWNDVHSLKQLGWM